jgi:hypothetical protein
VTRTFLYHPQVVQLRLWIGLVGENVRALYMPYMMIMYAWELLVSNTVSFYAFVNSTHLSFHLHSYIASNITWVSLCIEGGELRVLHMSMSISKKYQAVPVVL